MSKRKCEKHNILFKGRFIVTEDQVSPDLAFKLASRCSKKKKSLIKTCMKIHQNGFTIGSKSGLKKIRRLWFYFQDLKHFYIFAPFSNAVVIVNKMKNITYMSYFEFDQMIGLNRLTESIEISKGTPADQNKVESSESEDFDENVIEQINKAFEDENIDDVINPAPTPPIEEEVSPQDFTDFPGKPDLEDEEDNLDKTQSKIDNGFHSEYIDLFAENNEGTSFNDPKKRMAKIFNGSIFLFSQNFAAPVIDLYGACEEDDEDA